MLPPKQKFNKEFFVNAVLGELSQKIYSQHKYFHYDNAKPHLANEELENFGMKRLLILLVSILYKQKIFLK